MELTPTLILNLVLLIVPPVALVQVFQQGLAGHMYSHGKSDTGIRKPSDFVF